MSGAYLRVRGVQACLAGTRRPVSVICSQFQASVPHRLAPTDLLRRAPTCQGETSVVKQGGDSAEDVLVAAQLKPFVSTFQVHFPGKVEPGRHCFTAARYNRSVDWALVITGSSQNDRRNGDWQYFDFTLEAVNAPDQDRWQRSNAQMFVSVEEQIWFNPMRPLPERSCVHKVTHTFCHASPSVVVGHHADYRCSQAVLEIQVTVPVPPTSHAGDAELVLETGETFRVHSAFLKQSSASLAEALALAMGPADSEAKLVSLSVPGVSAEQAHLLLAAIYAKAASWDRHDSLQLWAHAQSFSDLLKLARVCNALACINLLAAAENALVRQASGHITAKHAVSLYRQARHLNMSRYQRACAEALVRCLPGIDLRSCSQGDDGLIPVLAAAKDKVNEQG